MTGQGSSKGNGAAIRMSNVKLKEKRQRSWARGEKRKLANKAKNDARETANKQALAELGGTQRNYERVTERRVLNKQGVVELKLVTRTKLESPGTALARTKREQA